MLITNIKTIYCPYCGESIEIIIDESVEFQEYTEDCSVCCRPIIISVGVGYDDIVKIEVKSEEDC